VSYTLESLRAVNASRMKRSPLGARDVAVAMCTIIKGLRDDTPERDAEIEKLRMEIADVVIYADLLAAHYGFELPPAIVERFNTIAKAGRHPERLP
jgi:hypothetical protein